MIIDQELRKKLIEHLPDDYQKQGNEATGFSRSMIYKVLHEGAENDTIYDWLVSTALKAKKKKDQETARRAAIAKQL